MSGKKIVIIDYGMGNTLCVSNAIKKLGYKSIVSQDKFEIDSSDAIVLPGVGAFKEAMHNLKSKNLINILNKNVLVDKKPIFGICLGMQLMAKSSEEMGYEKGLGWFDAEVKAIDFKDVKVPHVGWNSIEIIKKSPLFENIQSDVHFYFDHSFHFVCKKEDISSYTLYKELIVASVEKQNIFATQFHPEKSQNMGLRVLRNFLNYMEKEC